MSSAFAFARNAGSASLARMASTIGVAAAGIATV
jgi:hypothetical protein